MYTPSHFALNDPTAITQFIQANSFGILFSPVEGRPFATHLPFLYDEANGRLLTHFARANPQWRELEGAEVLTVFAGPHAYISPSWYVEAGAVPTWNYTTVHVYGTCRLVEDEAELGALLAQTVRYYEPDSPLLAHLHEESYSRMAKGVVGVEIAITRVEGKAKLSQNRSPESYRGVIEGLRKTQDPQAHAIADLMAERLK